MVAQAIARNRSFDIGVALLLILLEAFLASDPMSLAVSWRVRRGCLTLPRQIISNRSLEMARTVTVMPRWSKNIGIRARETAEAVLMADHVYAHAPMHCGHKGLFLDRLDAPAVEQDGTEVPRLVPFSDPCVHVRNRWYDPLFG